MEHETHRWNAIERWLGIDIGPGERDTLGRFERWLGDEAASAGGIGPSEHDRLFDRHIADSLAFLTGIPSNAHTALDVGGGVGLPSIPLAIVAPDIDFVLVDRSRKRTDLASRASRILGLENVRVEMADISAVSERYDVALFRASLQIPEAARVVESCVTPGGVGLFAVSRRMERPSVPSAPEGITFALSSEGGHVLESPFWLLRMGIT